MKALPSKKVNVDNFFLPNFCTLRTIFILAIGAELVAFMLILATGDILSESWDEFGLLSIFVQWIALSSAGVLCLSRKWLAKLSLSVAVITAYILVVITTALIALLAQYLLIKVNYQWGSVPETLGQFVSRVVSISAIMALVALRYFYILQQWKERIELESQARIEALQSRIRPHFLFNSMNIIASLIQTKPQLAEQAVEDLSEIFRATLRDSGSMVPLSEEWILCRNYLRIEGLRLGDRLQIDVDLSAVPENATIPMLTLQPLLENAIYHGIQALEKGGTIRIRGEMQDNLVHIKITNPVPLPSQSMPPQGNRIALVNIGHRLNLLFGSHARMVANRRKDEYEVTLIFPYVKSST